MMLRICLVVFFAAFAASIPVADNTTASSVPIWGGRLGWSAYVGMYVPGEQPQHPRWNFTYHYDGRVPADRYEHEEGQYDEVCTGFAQGDPCTVLNAVDGKMYLIAPKTGVCCVCRPSLAIRSDWLQDGGTSFVGEESVRGRKVDEWLKQGQYDNHYYDTADAEEQPVRYMEHKNGQLKQWDFLKFVGEMPDSDLLKAPAGCTEQCQTPVCQ